MFICIFNSLVVFAVVSVGSGLFQSSDLQMPQAFCTATPPPVPLLCLFTLVLNDVTEAWA